LETYQLVCFLCSQKLFMDTRTQILERNFEAIRISGFQGLRPDKVIAELGVTKGALYHYFPDKTTLGYAMVDELIAPRYKGLWQKLDEMNGHPIDNIQAVLRFQKTFLSASTVGYGCVLNNLMQEMSPLDEGFRVRLKNIIENQRQSIEYHLLKNSKQLNDRTIAAISSISISVLAANEGAYSIAKTIKSVETFHLIMEQICQWLDSYR